MCPCVHMLTTQKENLTREEIIKRAEQKAAIIMHEMALDQKTLISNRSKYSSAYDDRASAYGIGFVGVTVLLAIVCIIVSSDIIAMIKYLEEKFADKE